MTYPTPLPIVDDELIRLVSTVAAHGGNVHAINTEIGIYRNSVIGVSRLVGIVQERGEKVGDQADLDGRLNAAEKYRAILQRRVAAARQVLA